MLTPATPILTTKLGSYLTVPAFNFGGPNWLGASSCLGQFVYSAPMPFCLLGAPFSGIVNPNYILVIGYQNGAYRNRFILWNGSGLYFPLYTNQIIKRNYFIEVWDQPTGPATLTNPILLSTSIKFNRTRYMYPATPDVALPNSSMTSTVNSINGLHVPLTFASDVVTKGN